MKLLDVFKKRQQERVGSASLKHLVEDVKLQIENNTLVPNKQIVKLMKKAGVQPENYIAVYKQVIGLTLGVQTIDNAYERFQFDPDKARKVFLPQKEMVTICGAKTMAGQDSVVHQTVIEPSRKLIEYVFYKGKGLKLEGEVKNDAYYAECANQNLSDFTAACKVIGGLKTLTIGDAEYPVTDIVKNAAIAGLMNQATFVADAQKGMKK